MESTLYHLSSEQNFQVAASFFFFFGGPGGGIILITVILCSSFCPSQIFLCKIKGKGDLDNIGYWNSALN